MFKTDASTRRFLKSQERERKMPMNFLLLTGTLLLMLLMFAVMFLMLLDDAAVFAGA